MLSKLCLQELEVRSPGKVWENSNIRRSAADIIEPSLFTAAAAAASSAAGSAAVTYPSDVRGEVDSTLEESATEEEPVIAGGGGGA